MLIQATSSQMSELTHCLAATGVVDEGAAKLSARTTPQSRSRRCWSVGVVDDDDDDVGLKNVAGLQKQFLEWGSIASEQGCDSFESQCQSPLCKTTPITVM